MNCLNNLNSIILLVNLNNYCYCGENPRLNSVDTKMQDCSDEMLEKESLTDLNEDKAYVLPGYSNDDFKNVITYITKIEIKNSYNVSEKLFICMFYDLLDWKGKNKSADSIFCNKMVYVEGTCEHIESADFLVNSILLERFTAVTERAFTLINEDCNEKGQEFKKAADKIKDDILRNLPPSKEIPYDNTFKMICEDATKKYSELKSEICHYKLVSSLFNEFIFKKLHDLHLLISKYARNLKMIQVKDDLIESLKGNLKDNSKDNENKRLKGEISDVSVDDSEEHSEDICKALGIIGLTDVI